MSTKFNGVVVEVSGVRTIEGGGTGSNGADGVISINSSVDISNTLTVQSSLSSQSVYSTFYGDGSNITGIDRSFLPLSGGVVNGDLSINGTLSASSKLYGTLIDWMTLVRGYTTTPTLCATIAGGDVYNYTYNSSPSNVIYYRYIATNGGEDSFYTYFNGTNTLSGQVATKSITL